jgi:hypothetical protein
MIGVIVTFQYDEDTSSARESPPSRRRLIRTSRACLHSTVDDKQLRGTNVYLWDDDEAAAAFFSDELLEYATGLYGVSPTIDFVEVAAFVDNTQLREAPTPIAS